MALDLGGVGGLTPWGAAANALSGALSTPTSSSLTAGPVTTGPKVINIAGFGSKSNGTATQSLTQAEPDRGDAFPLSSVGGASVPDWVLPAAGAVLLLALVVSLVRRK